MAITDIIPATVSYEDAHGWLAPGFFVPKTTTSLSFKDDGANFEFYWDGAEWQKLTPYYVSNAGSDANDGRSKDATWETVTKVNAEQENLASASIVRFKCDDVFDDATLEIGKSGSSGSGIFYDSYGEGEKPIITSFTELGTWTDETGGIYSHDLTIEAGSIYDDSNFIRIMLTVDDGVCAMGRSAGWRIVDSVVDTNKFTDNDLTDDPNYEGAEIVVKPYPWIVQRRRITDHTGGTLTLASISGETTALTEGYGYYFQNHLDFCTNHGDWWYDDVNSKLYIYLDSAPANYTIKAATRNNLILIPGGWPVYNYLSFENLSLHGSNSNSIERRGYSGHSLYSNYNNLDINYSGGNGVLLQAVEHNTFSNNNINNSMECGILLGGSDNNTIINNVINNSGLIAGFGYYNYSGILIYGEYNLIQYNHIDSTGKHGIHIGMATGTEVRDNFVNNAGLTVDDIGGIYVNKDFAGRVIDGNIILNSWGNYEGTPSSSSQAVGIYIDEEAHGVTVTDNIMAHNRNAGMLIHKSTTCITDGNLYYNNGGRQFYLSAKTGTDGVIDNISFINNILIGDEETNPIMHVRSYYENPDYFQTINNNQYLRHLNVVEAFRTREPAPVGEVYYDFDDWKSYIAAQDAGNEGDADSEVTVIDKDNTHLIYNDTNEDKTFSVTGTLTDVKSGHEYEDENITLQPWVGMVLIGTGTVTVV